MRLKLFKSNNSINNSLDNDNNNVEYENVFNKKYDDFNKKLNIDKSNNPDNTYLKSFYFNIKSKLLINNEKNEEVLFKELKNKSLLNISDDNHSNDEYNQKKSINVFLNQNIQEFINLRLAIPLLLLFLAILGFLVFIFIGFEIALVILIISLMGFFIIFNLPRMQKEKKYSEISKELPYALRHMVTELRSGKGLHDTLNSIAISDYGPLSEEFSRVLEEIKYGETTETALLNMSHRVSSTGLNRTIQQIIGTIRTGGNLSNTLNIIAEDITHELQMKLKDYSQKLNAFIMIYTFLAILGPVIFLIMLMAASTVMGDVIPVNVVLLLYIFFFPMIVVFMGIMIKKLDPKI